MLDVMKRLQVQENKEHETHRKSLDEGIFAAVQAATAFSAAHSGELGPVVVLDEL